jgi:hypothetical protein
MRSSKNRVEYPTGALLQRSAPVKYQVSRTDTQRAAVGWKMVASAGDCRGDSSDGALGARAGKGRPRPPSPSSPLPPAGSRFWALSPSDDDLDVDELASVEVAAQQAASGGVAGRAPVTLGPFIDRAMGSPGWTRAGHGRHGRSRAAGAGPVAAASPSSSSDPDPGSDPGGSLDPADFPPLSSLPLSGSAAVGSGRSPVLQVGEFVFPARVPVRAVALGFSGATAAAAPQGSGPPVLWAPGVGVGWGSGRADRDPGLGGLCVSWASWAPSPFPSPACSVAQACLSS